MCVLICMLSECVCTKVFETKHFRNYPDDMISRVGLFLSLRVKRVHTGSRYTRSFPQSTIHQVNCNGSPRFGYLAGRECRVRGSPQGHSTPTRVTNPTPYFSLITRTFQQGEYYIYILFYRKKGDVLHFKMYYTCIKQYKITFWHDEDRKCI